MLEIIFFQLITLGIPFFLLGLVFLIDWKVSPIIREHNLDQVVFPLLFSVSLFLILGSFELLPQETTEALIWIVPFCVLTAWVKKTILKDGLIFLQLNAMAYFVLNPLLVDQTTSALLQWAVLNLATFGLLKGGKALSAKFSVQVIYALIIIVVGGYVTLHGSTSIGQIFMVVTVPLMLIAGYTKLTGHSLLLTRHGFVSIGVPVGLAAEYYNYVL